MKTAISLLAATAMLAAVPPAAAQNDGKVAGVGGIFGCSASGDSQEIGAGVGAVLGGFLGNRIAGRGNRVIGTVLGGALGAAAGSAVGCKLQKNDRDKAERAVQDAVLTGNDQSWTNPETGASGTVEVEDGGTSTGSGGGAALADVQFRDGVDPVDRFRSVNAAYVATANVNIRQAPTTAAPIRGRIMNGQRVWIPARVANQQWYLVSDGGVAQGYVSAPLMKPAVATQIAANNCRVVTQTVNVPGQGEQSEKMQACKGSDGNWSMTRV